MTAQDPVVDLAERRTFEDVWYLMVHDELPDVTGAAEFGERVTALLVVAAGLRRDPRPAVGGDAVFEVLRSGVSALGAAAGWADPDIDRERVGSTRPCVWAWWCRPSSRATSAAPRRTTPRLPRADLEHVAVPALDGHRLGAHARGRCVRWSST